MGKTMRRDKLFRLAQAGRLMMIESYHYDDMMGSDRSKEERPVRVMPEDRSQADHGLGIAYVYPSDFAGKPGHATLNDNGTVWVYIHSNNNFTVRILSEAEAAEVQAGLEAKLAARTAEYERLAAARAKPYSDAELADFAEKRNAALDEAEAKRAAALEGDENPLTRAF